MTLGLRREGNARGLFEGKLVASMLSGEPEYLLPLGEETPEGWIVTGYPWEQIISGTRVTDDHRPAARHLVRQRIT